MKRYGLIGYPLSHSFSQKFFTEKFEKLGINDCTYENFSLKSIDELNDLLRQSPGIEGLNVTIPYKEKVIPFLYYRNDVVKEIGACNCIKITGGMLSGYNTDVIGFENSLLPQLQPHHKKALVLGTGGAAKAIHYVLKKLGIAFKKVSRTPQKDQLSYEQVTAALLKEYLLIINTSPVGMYPEIDAFPPLPYDAITPLHYLFDLIYNPPKTVFLQKGESKGASIKNGQEMLEIQAEESWKIWTAID